MSKGQALAPDFISSVTLFASFLLGFALLWNFTLADQLSDLDESESNLRSYGSSLDLIASTGEPGNWESDDFSQIGLAEEPFNLDFHKMKELEHVPDLELRSSLNAINLYIEVIEKEVDYIRLGPESLERSERDGIKTSEYGVRAGYNENLVEPDFISLFEFNDRNQIIDMLSNSESDDYSEGSHSIGGLFSTGSIDFQREEDTEEIVVNSGNVDSYSYWNNTGEGWDHVAGNFGGDVFLNGDEDDISVAVSRISESEDETRIEIGNSFQGAMDQIIFMDESISEDDAETLAFNESTEFELVYPHLRFEDQMELEDIQANISKRPDQEIHLKVVSEKSGSEVLELTDGENYLDSSLKSSNFKLRINGSLNDLKDSWRVSSVGINFEDMGDWQSFEYGVIPEDEGFQHPTNRQVMINRPNDFNRAEVRFSIWR